MKNRNETVDVLRGIAMLMVVMGHTMTGCTVGAESTIFFNVIWTIQMPLFFLISGYVTRYSSAPAEWSDVKNTLLRRSRAYMLPWAVWTFLIRGGVLGQREYLDTSYLLWRMDSGYWFLASLWTITVIFMLAQFYSSAKKYPMLFLLIGYAAGMAALLALGMLLGISFFAIKQTLYYMLFFAMGVAFARFQKHRLVSHYARATVLCCAAVYWLLVLRVNFYTISDSLPGIALRGCASVCGCVCMSAAVSRMNISWGISRCLQWIGKNSMGIYLSHSLLLCMVKPAVSPAMDSIAGWGLVLLNFTVTVFLASTVAMLLDKNEYIRRLCLGK